MIFLLKCFHNLKKVPQTEHLDIDIDQTEDAEGFTPVFSFYRNI